MKLIIALLLTGLAFPLSASASYRAVVIDGNSGDILIDKQSEKRHAPASLTKMMTALVAEDHFTSRQQIKVGSYRPRADEQQLGLRQGQRIAVSQLLRASLVNSANDAAVALADGSGNRSRFVKAMNRKAMEVGMKNTRFIHPAGMDQPGQYTSARDMARLGRVLMLNPELSRIVGKSSTYFRGRQLLTTNKLLGGSVDGIKTGYTNRAKFSIVTSKHQGKRWVIAAVLGAKSSEERFLAADRLMDLGLAKINYRRIARRGQFVATMPVAYNNPAQIKLARSVSVWTASKEPLRQRLVGLPHNLQGPMAAGTRVGKVEYYLGKEKRGQSPLVLANSLSKPSFVERLLTDMPLLPLAIVMLLAGLVYFFIERSTASAKDDTSI